MTGKGYLVPERGSEVKAIQSASSDVRKCSAFLWVGNDTIPY